MEGAIPHERVAPLLAPHFVGLAADCDEPEPEVLDLARRLEDAMMLPFVLFTDAEGAFLEGYAGTGSAPYLVRVLERLVGSDGDSKASS